MRKQKRRCFLTGKIPGPPVDRFMSA